MRDIWNICLTFTHYQPWELETELVFGCLWYTYLIATIELIENVTELPT